MAKVAIVTGANQGLGLALVRGLCRMLGADGIVYLTARDRGLDNEGHLTAWRQENDRAWSRGGGPGTMLIQWAGLIATTSPPGSTGP